MKELFVYTGPVHSEKSTHTLRAARRYQRLHKRVVLVRPVQSIRPDPDDPEHGDRPGTLVTKNGEEFPSKDTGYARDILGFTVCKDVVWIDEPQLWPDEDEVFGIVTRLRREAVVLISGLSATSELEPFGESMPKLLAVADQIMLCKADCDECRTFMTASRSRHIGRVPKKGQVKVGGVADYDADCPACWSALT